ncbi:MAG: nucleotidyltransferase family protein [Nanoarchaeota archaeon]
MSEEINKIKQKIVPVLRAHKVSKAGIFGSYARGEQKKKSDVDILVEIPDDRSLFGVIELKIALEKALRRKVDLVEYELIRKELRKNILHDEIPVEL